MGCNCSKGGRLRDDITVTNSRSNGQGAYPLSTFPGCTELYRGELEGRSIYVVARGSNAEKLFPKGDLVAASTYAKSVKATIENLPTAALCAEAVLSVYA